MNRHEPHTDDTFGPAVINDVDPERPRPPQLRAYEAPTPARQPRDLAVVDQVIEIEGELMDRPARSNIVDVDFEVVDDGNPNQQPDKKAAQFQPGFPFKEKRINAERAVPRKMGKADLPDFGKTPDTEVTQCARASKLSKPKQLGGPGSA